MSVERARPSLNIWLLQRPMVDKNYPLPFLLSRMLKLDAMCKYPCASSVGNIWSRIMLSRLNKVHYQQLKNNYNLLRLTTRRRERKTERERAREGESAGSGGETRSGARSRKKQAGGAATLAAAHNALVCGSDGVTLQQLHCAANACARDSASATISSGGGGGGAAALLQRSQCCCRLRRRRHVNAHCAVCVQCAQFGLLRRSCTSFSSAKICANNCTSEQTCAAFKAHRRGRGRRAVEWDNTAAAADGSCRAARRRQQLLLLRLRTSPAALAREMPECLGQSSACLLLTTAISRRTRRRQCRRSWRSTQFGSATVFCVGSDCHQEAALRAISLRAKISLFASACFASYAVKRSNSSYTRYALEPGSKNL